MALPSAEALVSILSSFEKKLDLLTTMLARQQSLIDDLTKRAKHTKPHNQAATIKKLRVELAIQKQSYNELAAFMKVEEFDPTKTGPR